MRASSPPELSSTDLEQLRGWYKIRDTLFGENYSKRSFWSVLKLFAVCQHPNAVWLSNLFAGRDLKTCKEAREIFLGCERDPRALCLAGVIARSVDEIERAAVLGDAFAQAKMAGLARTKEAQNEWIEKSAAQGERNGLYQLGVRCKYELKKGSKENLEKAKENLLRAALLGYVEAMIAYGDLLDKADPQRCVWFGQAAKAGGSALRFLNEVEEQMTNFSAGIGLANVVFVIGRTLSGHIDSDKISIFRNFINFEARIVLARQAVRFFLFQLQSYRRAVDAWTVFALRNGVVRDIRKMIGKMIWEARDEAKYSNEERKTDRFYRADKRARGRK
jgi:hypothetical protein